MVPAWFDSLPRSECMRRGRKSFAFTLITAMNVVGFILHFSNRHSSVSILHFPAGKEGMIPRGDDLHVMSFTTPESGNIGMLGQWEEKKTIKKKKKQSYVYGLRARSDIMRWDEWRSKICSRMGCSSMRRCTPEALFWCFTYSSGSELIGTAGVRRGFTTV